MYTQCPHCSTAFRVTAQVLKQAAGKVRCGGCGAAFNALEFLSEEKPGVTPAAPEPERQLPELAPESSLADVDTPPEPPPAAMSPEQSTALRQTLGRLSDGEIQLEDTGMEWRIAGDALPDDDDTQSREIDAELLDLELPEGNTTEETPDAAMSDVFVDGESGDTLLDAELSAELRLKSVDEVLSSSPTPVDELLNEDGPASVDSADVFEDAAAGAEDELRFDDNTGLPDDFDIDEPEKPPEPVPTPAPVAASPEPAAAFDVDLGLADEWQDLLEEVDSEAAGTTASPAASVDPAVSAGPETLAALPTVIQSADEAAPDEASGPATESSDPGSDDSSDTPTLAEELEALDIQLPEDGEMSPVPGEELAGQMEALSLELSGLQEELDLLADRQAADGATADAPADTAETGMSIIDELDALDIDLEEEPGTSEPAETAEATADDADASDAPVLTEAEEPATGDLTAADDGAPDPDLLKEMLAAAAPEVVAADTEHYVPPPTEEEETINRLIDQDLMALAIEDEDGFASTIAVEQSADKSDDAREDDGEEAPSPQAPFGDADVSGTVETIVMEGDFSHIGHGFDDVVTEETPLPEEAELLAAAPTEDHVELRQSRDWRLIGGAVVLVLALIVQAVHFSRDALATSPAMNGLLSSVYGAIGMPLTPEWDVTGWRFEATRGSTDDAGEVLSIYSRIGNQADTALPYPVISVSLTDRFEETIGSRMLEPADYLEDTLDASALVEPGTSFNAAISIESPAAEATGFKLNVCYQLEGQKLRCAIEDFK